ncbi:MAG: Dabb family protein [Bacteroidetes bacterium]|nr:Dabb family protein [Bacteroidota bacterium]
MKNSPIYLISFFLLLSCAPKEKEQETDSSTRPKINLKNEAMTDSVLRHIVLFGFKKTSSQQDIDVIVAAFQVLPSKISEIKGFEWGVNSSPEGLNQGLTHAFTVTFHSDADRDAYIPHPTHQEFVGLLGPHLDKVTVIDYWTTK